MGVFLTKIFLEISKLTLSQLFLKVLRIVGLIALCLLFRYFFYWVSFPVLLPVRDLLDKVSLILSSKFGIVLSAEVAPNTFFNSFFNLSGGFSAPLEPLSSDQVVIEDRGPSSETKKGFPYKKWLIGGACVVGILFIFFSCGGATLGALELIDRQNCEHGKLLSEINHKVDFIAKQLILSRGIQVANSTDDVGFPDFVLKLWPGFKDTLTK